MIVTCDNCQKDFFNMLKEQTRQINGRTITRTYIECPHCGSQWDVCYDSDTTLGLKKQLRRRTKQIEMLQSNGDHKGAENAMKKVRKNKNRLNSMDCKLKTLWETTK